MPNKLQNLYVCSKCDAQFSKWNGRCLECGAWGTLRARIVDQKEKEKSSAAGIEPARIVDFAEIKESSLARLKTGISEADRVLGGGIVRGSLVLLGGEPGIGKSTILAQAASRISSGGASVVYASGEESGAQVKSRFERLGCDLKNLKFINEVNVEKIIAAVAKEKPDLVIIDSIQTVYSSFVEAEPGGVSQIRTSAVKFLEIAKENNIAFVLVGHITKDGQLAGPKTLEHIVDAVVYLESDNSHGYRILRSSKNRFGSVNELGVFEMTGRGFEEIKNPSSIFLNEEVEGISGSAISCVFEGSRPFFVEVQALVTKTVFGYPQRKAAGIDLNRLQILSSVLNKRAKINLSNQDIILNVVGGIKVNDPVIDLAACAAMVSSLLSRSISRKTIVLGEVGLGGEVRATSKIAQTVKEAEKMGFDKAIIPGAKASSKQMELVEVKKIDNLINVL